MSRPTNRGRWARSIAVAGLTVSLAAGAVACGGSSVAGAPVAQTGASAATSAPGTNQGTAGRGARGGANGTNGFGGIRPAAFGTIAAASPGMFEVQSTTSQTTVNYSATTAISQTKTVDISAVTVGSCVLATAGGAPGAGGSGQASGSAGATPSTTAPTTAAPTTAPTTAPSSSGTSSSGLTATSVRISAPVNGACTGLFGGGAGGRFAPGGAGGGRHGHVAATGQEPSGSATAGGQGRAGGFGGRVAIGTVTSAGSGSIVITPVALPNGGAAETSSAAGSTPAPVTVTVTADTVYSQSGPTDSSAIQVGLCASVTGTADTTGAVAATAIALSTPGAQGCTTGFGRRGPGRTVGPEQYQRNGDEQWVSIRQIHQLFRW